MNDFERRALEVAQNSSLLAAIAREGRNIVNIDYFAYNGRIGSIAAPIAAAGQGQVIIPIQADSDFILTYMSAITLATPECTVQITDTGSGKTFFNEQTLVGLVFGNGGFPFLLPSPRVVNPSTNIKVDLTNVSAATPMTGAYFSFLGARIYYAN